MEPNGAEWSGAEPSEPSGAESAGYTFKTQTMHLKSSVTNRPHCSHSHATPFVPNL